MIPEVIAAVIGMVVCLGLGLAGIAAAKDKDADMPLFFYVAVLFLVCAVYFLVRFIHWAWATPIPFIR